MDVSSVGFPPLPSRIEQDLARGPIFPKRPLNQVGGHVQPVSLCCQLPEVSRVVAIPPIGFYATN